MSRYNGKTVDWDIKNQMKQKPKRPSRPNETWGKCMLKNEQIKLDMDSIDPLRNAPSRAGTFEEVKSLGEDKFWPV